MRESDTKRGLQGLKPEKPRLTAIKVSTLLLWTLLEAWSIDKLNVMPETFFQPGHHCIIDQLLEILRGTATRHSETKLIG
jgi:hypothetical protein